MAEIDFYRGTAKMTKPLVGDPSVLGAKVVHEAQDFALEGTYGVKGMENGPERVN